MTWSLVLVALLLLVLGFWGGPRRSERSSAQQFDAARPVSTDNAWEIITQPLQRESLIELPEHRPWYLPGRDRRFLQGLLSGMGAGLLAAALVISLAPRDQVPPSVAHTEDQRPPAGVIPAPAVPEPSQPSPQPVTVAFVVEVGELSPTIAANLQDAGLISDEEKFLERITVLGVDTRLQAGTFIIPTDATLDEVIAALIA